MGIHACASTLASRALTGSPSPGAGRRSSHAPAGRQSQAWRDHEPSQCVQSSTEAAARRHRGAGGGGEPRGHRGVAQPAARGFAPQTLSPRLGHVAAAFECRRLVCDVAARELGACWLVTHACAPPEREQPAHAGPHAAATRSKRWQHAIACYSTIPQLTMEVVKVRSLWGAGTGGRGGGEREARSGESYIRRTAAVHRGAPTASSAERGPAALRAPADGWASACCAAYELQGGFCPRGALVGRRGGPAAHVLLRRLVAQDVEGLPVALWDLRACACVCLHVCA